MITKELILQVLQLGLKDDGKTFYSNEEKAEILESYFKDNSELYKKGWNDGYLKCQNDILEENKPVRSCLGSKLAVRTLGA